MTLKQALAVLAANDAAAEGTFMHAVHERRRFDTATFWSLFIAAVVIGQAPPRARGSGVRRQAFRVYKHILESIICHFQPQDLYRMRGLPRRLLSAYLARLEWAFEPVIMGKRGYRWVMDFGDGLRTPHHAALVRRFGTRTKARGSRQRRPRPSP